MMTFTPSLLTPRHWLTWCGVAVLFVLAWLPWQVRARLGKRLGNWIYQHNRKRRHIVATNLGLCFPTQTPQQREQIVIAHLQEYACALLDYSLLFFRSRAWLYQRTQIEGREHIDQAIANGQNVILLLGHSVWLEFAPLVIGQHYRAYGSYKPFHNPVFNWLIARSRLRDVETVVAREEGMLKLVRTLAPGRLLFFLPDEDHGAKNSVFAPFFGVEKATLTTPARLAKLGKAVVLPIMAYRLPQSKQYCIRIAPPLVAFGTQEPRQDAYALNTALEQLIRVQPQQYMWVLKLFRTRPNGEAAVY